MFKPAVISVMCFAAAFSVSGVERQDSLHGTLKEVVVTADGAQHNLKAPEMGHHSLDAKQIYKLPVMLGEPDLVKSIQSLPGVSQGVEGFTGLYVHGGDNDQNLFLYEELPLYHVSHLGASSLLSTWQQSIVWIFSKQLSLQNTEDAYQA